MIEYYRSTESGIITCDDCGANEEIKAEDFVQLVQRAKDLGWQFLKSGTSWEHYCINCRD